MKAFVLIKVRTGDVQAVVQELRKTNLITEAHMTFGPYDAVAVVEASDLGAIGYLVASIIQPIDGVEQTLTCLVADT